MWIPLKLHGWGQDSEGIFFSRGLKNLSILHTECYINQLMFLYTRLTFRQIIRSSFQSSLTPRGRNLLSSRRHSCRVHRKPPPKHFLSEVQCYTSQWQAQVNLDLATSQASYCNFLILFQGKYRSQKMKYGNIDFLAVNSIFNRLTSFASLAIFQSYEISFNTGSCVFVLGPSNCCKYSGKSHCSLCPLQIVLSKQ